MKIALLQIGAADNLEKTLKKGVSFCRKSKALGADVALFPEMFSNGYNIYNRPVTEWVKDAKELNMAIRIAFLEKYETGPKNTLLLFERITWVNLEFYEVRRNLL